MKKKDIILRLLQEKYEANEISNQLLQQMQEGKNALERSHTHLAEQVATLTEENRELRKQPSRYPESVVRRMNPTRLHTSVARQGTISIQQGPAATGKSTRARDWLAYSPSTRRVVDGDYNEARRLSDDGFDVMLNLLPGM